MTSARYVGELSRAALADQDGLAVVIKIFMDESGTHDDSPVVTVAAYVGRPKSWQQFTKEWNVAKRPIKVFHATDCASLHGEFEGWSKAEQIEYVKNLLPVLARHKLIGVAMGLNLKDFEQELSGRPKAIKEFVGTPYTQCFQWVVENILWLQESENNNERLAFFHEENEFQVEALAAFNYVKGRRKRHSSLMTLTFAPKAAFVPLQAADVLAFEANKRLRDPTKPHRKPIAAIDPTAIITLT